MSVKEDSEFIFFAVPSLISLCPRGFLHIFRAVKERQAKGEKLVLTASAVELNFTEGNIDLLLKTKRVAAEGAMWGRFTGASGVSLDKTNKPPRLYGQTQIILDDLEDIRAVFQAISAR